MKKKHIQKLFAMALTCVTIVGTLAGCGAGEAASTENESNTATDEVIEATENTVAGIEGWKAFDENVTLKVPVYDRGAEGIDPVTDNGYTRFVQENFGDKYNITVEFVPITRNDVLTDYALLAASDDLPTILMEYDYPKVAQWANDGYMQPYEMEAFAHVAPTYYQRMVDLEQLDYASINGETYFVLSERPYYDTTYNNVYLCRMDWLREVGYDHVPANYEEYIDAMQKIKDAGISEYPIGGNMLFASTTFSVDSFSFRDAEISEAEWAQNSSLGTAPISWEPVKKWMKRANAEYNAGLMDPEYFTIDSETEKANFINGKQFAYDGYMAKSVDWLESFYEANPDAELAILFDYWRLEDGVVDEVQMRSNNPYGMIIGFSNAATEEELTAAWMYMEWAALNVKELQNHAEDWNNFNNSVDFWCITTAAVKEDTIEETIAAIVPQGLPQDFTEELLEYYYYLKGIADEGNAYTDPQFSVVIDSESEYTSTLLSLAIEYYDTLVMCETDEFDAKYEELSKEYLEAGYQEIIEERLAAYESGNSTKLPK